MESGWNVWVWLVGVVSRRWVWLVGVGVATGCGFKEIYRFPHTTYPYSSCICPFLQQHPYFFFHFVKMILRSLIIITPHTVSHFPHKYHTRTMQCIPLTFHPPTVHHLLYCAAEEMSNCTQFYCANSFELVTLHVCICTAEYRIRWIFRYT